MQLSRLRGRKICGALARNGRQWKGKHLSIRFAIGTPRHPDANFGVNQVYVGTITSAKLDKSAVRRNRMRRRCREALRTMLLEYPTFPFAVQLLIAPRSSSLSAPFPEIQRDLRAFLLSINVPLIQSVQERQQL